MKQYVYQIIGALSAEQIRTIMEDIPKTDGVSSVDIQPSDGERQGYLTVDWSSVPAAETLAAWEDDMAACLGRHSECELSRPALQDRYVVDVPVKPRRQISLGTAIGTVITAVVLAVLLTFAIMTSFVGKDNAAATPAENDSRFEQLDTLDRIFRMMSPLELDDQELLAQVLKAYVAATGDTYAEYFTDEEYAAYADSQSGTTVGIGIQVVEGSITVSGTEYAAIIVVDVYPDSPAEAAGIQSGDAIMYVGTGDDRAMVHTIGYEHALKLLAGEAGTTAEFELFRPSAGEPSGYESVTISAVRREIQSRSVHFRVCATDASVGIIRISSFDKTTPEQFAKAVDSLKEQGCEQFVFDLRNNPGGALTSVVDVLTYFSRVGDTVISIKDKNGSEETVRISDQVSASTGKLLTGSGTLEPSDIGKYRQLKFTVLTNEYTASAAELFAANMRDYQLGTLVGTKTYGKGSIQTFLSLKPYGCSGVLKLTYGYYYPPCGEGYHGVGIEPDVSVALSGEALTYKNFNLLPDDKDDQLQKAIEIMKGAA